MPIEASHLLLLQDISEFLTFAHTLQSNAEGESQMYAESQRLRQMVSSLVLADIRTFFECDTHREAETDLELAKMLALQ